MCGLAGILAPPSSEGEARVRGMVDGLRHRGPDGSGYFRAELGPHVLAFGHTRLAIIDRSSAGAQPMIDPGTGSALIYNGEIYNFKELRRELVAQGASFAGNSDTEVLLKGLALRGAAFIPLLAGMFAFAYFDNRRKSLLLARDPLGIKPLFMARKPNLLVFASEVRTILASGLVAAEVSRPALAGLLAYGAVQQPLTLYKGIESIPAGTSVQMDIGPDGMVSGTPQRFWSLPLPDSRKTSREAVEETQALLSRAVTSHLVSDVPVAVFLSSGLDSTIVSSIASRALPGLQTFTVGLADHIEHDESIIAARTAQQLDIHHTTIQLPLGEARENVLTWLARSDQPCMDGLNTFVISRAVRMAGITVALSGQGGDELFGGYPSFVEVPRLAAAVTNVRHLPQRARRALVRIAATGRSRSFSEKLLDASGTDGSLLSIYLQRRRALSDSQMAGLGFASDAGHVAPYMPDAALENVRLVGNDDTYDISAMELQLYLGNTLLPVGDASTMANSLELRVPFLDVNLVAAIAATPGGVRLPNRRADKFLLRSAFGSCLRPEVQHQRKRGFTLPLGTWMSGALREQCEQFLGTLKQSGLVDAGGVDRVWSDFLEEPQSPMWSRAWVLCALGSHLHFSGAR